MTISIPGNATVNKITLNSDDIRKMLESGQSFDKAKDITPFLGKSKYTQQSYSDCLAIYNAIRGRKNTTSKAVAKQEEL
ncbi:hypothetical protein [Parablautia muri]|uniref:hypothetical protein n=1 Tax=Parablautia muri TaxID=2320879 RepID=UPI00136A8340|nr:hypothetical protein [Parablautia muri]